MQMINIAICTCLTFFSIAGLSIVFMTIFYSNKLKEHPSPLIARISMAEAIMCWFTLIKVVHVDYIVCYFKMYDNVKLFMHIK